MRRKLFTFAILTLTVLNFSYAQTRGPHFRQFLTNPYLFNPAYVGINNQPEVSMVYRQQWVNFKDAPVITGLNVQFPTGNRVSMGISLNTDKQVMLRHSTLMGTFGYNIPLAENQSLRFGISAGMGMNSLDLNEEEQNSNDPALMKAMDNNFYVDGNVGFVYSYGGFKIGFAFTDIFNSNSFSHETFNKFSMSNLKNRLYSASYRFNVGVMQNVAMEPFALYRQSDDGLQDSWEAGSLIYFKEKVWTGAGYNSNNGLALFLGMDVKEKFKFTYSYEFPPFSTGVTATSAHELHLSMKFGKKKTMSFAQQNRKAATYKRSSPKLMASRSRNNPKVVASKPKPTVNVKKDTTAMLERKPAETYVKQNPEDVTVETPKESPVAKPVGKPARTFTISKGHYVVVGVFSQLDHSTKFTKKLMQQGYRSNVTLNPKNKLYYVYIFSSYDLDEARKMRNQYRWKNLFKEAWVFTME
jgi:type IX secretion system PorP/SprF family membrane protein